MTTPAHVMFTFDQHVNCVFIYKAINKNVQQIRLENKDIGSPLETFR